MRYARTKSVKHLKYALMFISENTPFHLSKTQFQSKFIHSKYLVEVVPFMLF